MRGTLKKRSKGSWTLTFDAGRGQDGKRCRQTVTVRGTKRQAEARLAELVHHVDTGAYVKPSMETVGTFLQRWLDDYISGQIRPTTLEAYWQRGKHLINGLGHIPLAELRPEHIHQYYRDKGQSLCAATLISITIYSTKPSRMLSDGRVSFVMSQKLSIHHESPGKKCEP